MSTATTVVHSKGGKEYHKGELCLKEIRDGKTSSEQSVIILLY